MADQDDDEVLPEQRLRTLVGHNLTKIIEAWSKQQFGPDAKPNYTGWARAKGFKQPMDVLRAGKAQVSTGIDKLQQIADAAGFPLWQLLHPQFDPATPPTNIAHLAPWVIEAANILNRIPDPDRRRKAYSLVTGLFELGLTPPSLSPEPSATPTVSPATDPEKLP
jgi:hypothetical protein